ncbi:MAG: DUF523 domain-containing protein [Gammaproteobacteria bacterium]
MIKPRIGVSACLLGHEVRYDGDHRKNDWLLRVASEIVEFVPVCPEMAVGLGVPRPAVELTGTAGAIHATGVEDGSLDVTQALQRYAQQTAAISSDLSGYIFKGKSPSCGLNVRLNGEFLEPPVMGIFSRVIHERLPLLPIAEIESLKNDEQCASFILRVKKYQQSINGL